MANRNHHKKKKELQVGNSVVVKNGVKDVDFDVEMGGWQGRIVSIKKNDDGDIILLIEWDSVTLGNFPDDFFEVCEEKGASWSEYYIPSHEVKITTPRDSKANTQQAIREYERKFAWAYLGPEGKGIQAVLKGVDFSDDYACFEAWYEHFDKLLRFPIKAEISEWQERSPHKAGDKLEILSLEDIIDPYGILVEVRKGKQKFTFPLCDLKATDQSSKPHDYLQEYAVWFANR